MPVTPLPPENTTRWRVRYNNGIDTHSLTLRTIDSLTAAAVSAFFNDIFQAAAPFLPAITIIALDRIAQGSNVGIPQPLGSLLAGYGTGTLQLVSSPNTLTFSGRSLLGRKNHIAFLGVKVSADSNYIYGPGELAAVGAVVNQLNAAGADIGIGIDGAETNWYPRATFKANDHFVRRRRSG